MNLDERDEWLTANSEANEGIPEDELDACLERLKARAGMKRRYTKKESSQETADRVESVIRSKFLYLANFRTGDIGGMT